MVESSDKFASSRVFILTGMSRSGTSLSASLLQAAGVSMGERQLMAHAGNAKGHFENIDFLDFHRSILRERQLPDAGWISSGRIDVSPTRIVDARRVMAVNAAAAGSAGWGWKDPRTTLFLDFWQELVPEAHFIFIYRTPWEVVDSIFRRGVSEDLYFRDRPEEAVRVWAHYNRCLLDFMQRYPGRSVLVSLEGVTADPAAFIRLINARFGACLNVPADVIVERELLHQQEGISPWAKLVARSFPDAIKLLTSLDTACSLRAAATELQALESLAKEMESVSGTEHVERNAGQFREWFDGHAKARAATKRKARLRRWFGRRTG